MCGRRVQETYKAERKLVSLQEAELAAENLHRKDTKAMENNGCVAANQTSSRHEAGGFL